MDMGPEPILIRVYPQTYRSRSCIAQDIVLDSLAGREDCLVSHATVPCAVLTYQWHLLSFIDLLYYLEH